jgi:hypothetical protein
VLPLQQQTKHAYTIFLAIAAAIAGGGYVLKPAAATVKGVLVWCSWCTAAAEEMHHSDDIVYPDVGMELCKSLSQATVEELELRTLADCCSDRWCNYRLASAQWVDVAAAALLACSW